MDSRRSNDIERERGREGERRERERREREKERELGPWLQRACAMFQSQEMYGT